MGPASWIEEEAQLRGFADVAGDADRVDLVAEEHRLFQRDQAGAGELEHTVQHCFDDRPSIDSYRSQRQVLGQVYRGAAQQDGRRDPLPGYRPMSASAGRPPARLRSPK